jgi:hypothetical protein
MPGFPFAVLLVLLKTRKQAGSIIYNWCYNSLLFEYQNIGTYYCTCSLLFYLIVALFGTLVSTFFGLS